MAQTTSAPISKLASSLPPQKAEWFWKHRVQKNSINIVEGPGGSGKTTILCALTAAVTTPGVSFPEFTNQRAQKVMWLAPEADANCELVPALMAAGANLELVSIIQQSALMTGQPLEREIERVRPDLLIIDPFSACCDGDPNKPQTARGATNALMILCKKFNLTVILVRHLSKSRGMGNADTAGLYSGEWSAAARSVLLVGYDPLDREVKAVVHTKCNNGPIMPGFGFRIEGVDGEFGGKRVEWMGDAEITAEEILSLPHNNLKGVKAAGEAKGEKVVEAEQFLLRFFADGPKLSQELEEARAMANISKSTLERAKKGVMLVKVAVGRRGQADQQYRWGFYDQIGEGRDA